MIKLILYEIKFNLKMKAFGITDDSRYNENHDYVWKGVVMMGGVYLFYLVEKILKIMILRRKVFFFYFNLIMGELFKIF